MSQGEKAVGRRAFLGDVLRVTGAAGLLGAAGVLAARKGQGGEMVWQIDPHTCIACGNCATKCVLDQSAVKCMHNFHMCGYCELCTGYFEPEPAALDSGG